MAKKQKQKKISKKNEIRKLMSVYMETWRALDAYDKKAVVGWKRK